ncbi:hypothetical protein OAO87_00395 [bacterium]|nr:hypothetical protein [bacterium]
MFFAYQYGDADLRLREFYRKLLDMYDNVIDKRKEQFDSLLRFMTHNNKEREKHWFKLPLSAYEGDLRFTDSVCGVRNVPLKKKKRIGVEAM